MTTRPEPLDDFHGVDTGVCGGVRIDAFEEKLSRGVMETSPRMDDIADSRMFKLTKACWCRWLLLEAAA